MRGRCYLSAIQCQAGLPTPISVNSMTGKGTGALIRPDEGYVEVLAAADATYEGSRARLPQEWAARIQAVERSKVSDSLSSVRCT